MTTQKPDKWRLITFSFLLITLCLLAASHSAKAAGTAWSRWKIDVIFPNNQIDTQLTIQVGHTTSTGKKVVDAEQAFPLSCLTVGTPNIQNEQAKFAGNSYFKCQVPSIQDKVSQMPGHLLIPPACDSKQPFVTGVLSVDNNPTQSNPDNPIFHRDDIQFNTPFDTTTQQAQMTVTFNQATAESGTFTPSQTESSLVAIYNKAGQSLYAPAFTVDSTNLTASPATLNGPIPLSTLASTIYIGYSPVSSKYFHGTLTSLLVDPVCIGQG